MFGWLSKHFPKQKNGFSFFLRPLSSSPAIIDTPEPKKSFHHLQLFIDFLSQNCDDRAQSEVCSSLAKYFMQSPKINTEKKLWSKIKLTVHKQLSSEQLDELYSHFCASSEFFLDHATLEFAGYQLKSPELTSLVSTAGKHLHQIYFPYSDNNLRSLALRPPPPSKMIDKNILDVSVSLRTFLSSPSNHQKIQEIIEKTVFITNVPLDATVIDVAQVYIPLSSLLSSPPRSSSPLSSPLLSSPPFFFPFLSTLLSVSCVQGFSSCGAIDTIELFDERLRSSLNVIQKTQQKNKILMSKSELEKLMECSQSPIYGVIIFREKSGAANCLSPHLRTFGVPIGPSRRLVFPDEASKKNTLVLSNFPFQIKFPFLMSLLCERLMETANFSHLTSPMDGTLARVLESSIFDEETGDIEGYLEEERKGEERRGEERREEKGKKKGRGRKKTAVVDEGMAGDQAGWERYKEREAEERREKLIYQIIKTGEKKWIEEVDMKAVNPNLWFYDYLTVSHSSSANYPTVSSSPFDDQYFPSRSRETESWQSQSFAEETACLASPLNYFNLETAEYVATEATKYLPDSHSVDCSQNLMDVNTLEFNNHGSLVLRFPSFFDALLCHQVFKNLTLFDRNLMCGFYPQKLMYCEKNKSFMDCKLSPRCYETPANFSPNQILHDSASKNLNQNLLTRFHQISNPKWGHSLLFSLHQRRSLASETEDLPDM